MPWTPQDAHKHTHLARTKRLRKLWAAVANSVLERTGDEVAAIKAANSRVQKEVRRKKR